MVLKHDVRKKEGSQSFFSKNLTKVSCLNISEQEKCLVGSFGLLVISLVLQAKHCGYIVNKNFTKTIDVSYNKLFKQMEKNLSEFYFIL